MVMVMMMTGLAEILLQVIQRIIMPVMIMMLKITIPVIIRDMEPIVAGILLPSIITAPGFVQLPAAGGKILTGLVTVLK